MSGLRTKLTRGWLLAARLIDWILEAASTWFWLRAPRLRAAIAGATAIGLVMADIAGWVRPAGHAQQAWVQYIYYIVVLILAIWAYSQAQKKIKPQEAQKADVPVVKDGARVRRYYGTCWRTDPVVLAMRQVDPPEPIKKKGGK